MTRIYLSSTRQDLDEYRREVADTLTNCGYVVDAMERHAARDDAPRTASEADVTHSDAYVGIVAWRYGYIPAGNNVQGRSITELEYLAAEAARIPRFIFLLADDVAWPDALRDDRPEQVGGTRVRDFRARLARDRWVAFFRSPDDLARQVLMSVVQYQSMKQAQSLTAIDDIATRTYEIGVSFLPDIRNRLESIGGVEFAILRLGPTPWWNTRLHLMSALTSDFTEVRQFLILDWDGRFLTMTSPVELRRALAKTQPRLELAYLKSRDDAARYDGSVDRVIYAYPGAVADVFGAPEASIKRAMTSAELREVPIRAQGEVLEVADRPALLLSADIVRRPTPYVALMQKGKSLGVVDRADLASRLATIALQAGFRGSSREH